MFPLQQSYDPNNFDIWQQDDDILTELFLEHKDDPRQFSLDDFRSYLEDFDEYSFENSDLFYEEIINHRCAQFLIRVRNLLA